MIETFYSKISVFLQDGTEVIYEEETPLSIEGLDYKVKDGMAIVAWNDTSEDEVCSNQYPLETIHHVETVEKIIRA